MNPIWGLFNDCWERDPINFKSRHIFQFFLKENRLWSHSFSIVLKLGCCQYVSITLTLKDPQVSCYKPQTCIPQISMRYIIIIPQILPGHWYKNSPMVLHFILRYGHRLIRIHQPYMFPSWICSFLLIFPILLFSSKPLEQSALKKYQEEVQELQGGCGKTIELLWDIYIFELWEWDTATE